jgi:hypothetical protein
VQGKSEAPRSPRGFAPPYASVGPPSKESKEAAYAREHRRNPRSLKINIEGKSFSLNASACWSLGLTCPCPVPCVVRTDVLEQTDDLGTKYARTLEAGLTPEEHDRRILLHVKSKKTDVSGRPFSEAFFACVCISVRCGVLP